LQGSLLATRHSLLATRYSQLATCNLQLATHMHDYILTFGPLNTTVIELVSVIFGLGSVWSMKKESILAFPFGIINVLGYVYINFVKDLYALSGINLFFAVMSIYGWYNWSRQKDDTNAVSISRLSGRDLLYNAGAFIFFFFFLRIILSRYTDSPIPTWDALTTAFYIIAMWLLARKKIENWIAWIAGDFISIFLYAIPYTNNQTNYFSSFQFLVFTIIAVFGFLEWRGKLNGDIAK
jgi:nicotinamide mononucleotide transporter